MNVKSGNTALFSEERIINLINNDGGKVNYYGKIMTSIEANRCFDLLFQNILWENEEVVIFGKHIVTKRKVAWYGDSKLLVYLFEYYKTSISMDKRTYTPEAESRGTCWNKIQFLFVEFVSQRTGRNGVA